MAFVPLAKAGPSHASRSSELYAYTPVVVFIVASLQWSLGVTKTQTRSWS